MSKHVDPATDKTAFTCPHCGAYTTQVWYGLRAVEMKDPAYPCTTRLTPIGMRTCVD